MTSSKVIYLGIKGSVIALDAATGRQLWATHLKSVGFVNVVLDGDKLYAATYGEIFCLDPKTGAGLWHNPLKGFGLGLISIAGESITPSSLLNMVEEIHRQEEAANSAAQTSTMSAAS